MTRYVWPAIVGLLTGLGLWWVLTGPVYPYDSMTANGDGTITYTMTAETSDGRIQCEDADWGIARINGEAFNSTEEFSASDQSEGAFLHTGQYIVYRSWIPFDLTGIFGTCTAADFVFTSKSAQGGVGATYLCFQQGNATLPLDVSDFTSFTGGEVASRKDHNLMNSDGAHFTMTLNSTGLAGLTAAENGAWQMCLRNDQDIDNTAPVMDGLRMGIYYADSTTAANRPSLIATFRPEISDLFDDASIAAKWTTTDVFSGGGIVTEADGYLTMDFPASGLSIPEARQYSSIANLTFDIRAAIHLDAALPSDDVIWFFISQDAADWGSYGPNDAVCIEMFPGTGASVLRRADNVGGSRASGGSVSLNNAMDWYVRIVGNGDGTFTCYYKTSPGAEWTALTNSGTKFTSSTLPLDITLSAGQQTAGGQTVDFDWIVEDGEYPGYPLPEGQRIINFF